MKPVRPDEDLPKATHEEIMKIGDFELRTYVLDDGRRIISAEDFEKFFEAMAGAEAQQ